jgi:hypothetical protein
MSLGASGTIGKTLTASKWKGQPYFRQRVVPANPQTASQNAVRGAFQTASGIWKNAGPLLTAPWDLYAKGQVLTGRNAFIGAFTRDNQGQVNMDNMVFSPGAKGGVAPASAIATPGSSELSIAITPPTPPTGWTVTLCAAACIVNADPETTTDYITIEGSDNTDPYAVVLSGLTPTVEYQWGAWIEWAKADGSVAYGASIIGQATPTV